MTDTGHQLEFIYTPLFETTAADLLDDEALRHIELTLLAEPRAGAVVAGTGGIRKLRVPLPGRGKRGGARLVYLYIEVRGLSTFSSPTQRMSKSTSQRPTRKCSGPW